MGEKSEERLALEAEADELGVTYPKNIGDAKLAGRIEKARAAKGDGPVQNDPAGDDGSGTDTSSQITPPEDQPAIQPDETSTASDGQIRVIGPRRGRWRAGRHFTPEPVTIDVDDLSEAELDAILDDPVLQAVRVPAEPL